MKFNQLKTEYEQRSTIYHKLRSTVLTQLSELLSHDSIVLGVPMESRVKSWDSIQEKLDRKGLPGGDLSELSDLVGVRAILLFRSDLPRADQLIRKTFEIVDSEDAASRLGETQFGYQSQHYTVRLPKKWLDIPSFTDLGNLKVEIQVRTLAQHVWAAASHTLQYKHEESVPPPLRRTINRISALLETVDLEFDRVLDERRTYIENSAKADDSDEPLNVDILASALDSMLPPQNRDDSDRYDELLVQLGTHGVRTLGSLRTLWSQHRAEVLREEAREVRRCLSEGDDLRTSEERLNRGVYFTHVGLIRRALFCAFGDEVFQTDPGMPAP